MALVVVDEFPIEVCSTDKLCLSHSYWYCARLSTRISWITRRNCQAYNVSGWQALMTDSRYGTPRAHGNRAPISEQWKSPFIGETLRQIGAFIRNAPKPSKPLCNEICAVLTKEPYEERGEILICKIPPVGDESEPQAIPTEHNTLDTFLIGFDREDWQIYHNDQIMWYDLGSVPSSWEVAYALLYHYTSRLTGALRFAAKL